LPLAWFGIYRSPRSGPEWKTTSPMQSPMATAGTDWEPTVTRAHFTEAISLIQEAIARGEVEQVNYTLRLQAPGTDDPGAALAYFRRLLAAQGTAYGAWLDLGSSWILSASPELFFRRTADRITTLPMKGTARRGRWVEEDDEAAAALAGSAKD